MQQLIRQILKVLIPAGLLATVTACYGVPLPPEHPTVRLTDFTYTPASPIRIGDTLKLEAVTNKPAEAASIFAYLPESVVGAITLKDDGQSPDAAAGDGRWSAELRWTEEMGTVDAGLVEANLTFEGDYMWQTKFAPPLTVLDKEDEQ